VVGLVMADLQAGAAIFVLGMVWVLLETHGMPPVLALALTFQWLQVAVGIFYARLTGRELATMILSDYVPMVWIGLGTVSALAIGLALGRRLLPGADRTRPRAALGISWVLLGCVYAGLTALEGPLTRLAWDTPGLTQAILALSLMRLGALYLMMRRLATPEIRWLPLMILLMVEVVLGLTGYFAGFREPLFLAAAVLFESIDRSRVQHWLAITLIGLMAVTTSVVWIGIRDIYRSEFQVGVIFDISREVRLSRLSELTRSWVASSDTTFLYDVEALVDRVWAVYYPALAVQRVPDALPHTEGVLLSTAVQHATLPRIFFPDKAEMPSDSELVRQYSGVYVAGRDEGTSIAFGYAAESYVDFGVPLMFLPVLVFGLLMGIAFSTLARVLHYEEIAVPVLVVVFWLALYSFERSWHNMMGYGGTLLLYLGGGGYLVDRVLWHRAMRDHAELEPVAPPAWTADVSTDPTVIPPR